MCGDWHTQSRCSEMVKVEMGRLRGQGWADEATVEAGKHPDPEGRVNLAPWNGSNGKKLRERFVELPFPEGKLRSGAHTAHW